MREPLVLGLVGWSGAGKTTLLKKLLPLLTARGLRVATIKHAHHDFEVDLPGKDSWEHRKAGAGEVIVSSSRRWVQMHELHAEAEPTLAALLRRLSPCDLILIEGFKSERHPKLEVYRQVNGKPALCVSDDTIAAVASDVALPVAVPRLHLEETAVISDHILSIAKPLSMVLAALERR